MIHVGGQIVATDYWWDVFWPSAFAILKTVKITGGERMDIIYYLFYKRSWLRHGTEGQRLSQQSHLSSRFLLCILFFVHIFSAVCTLSAKLCSLKICFFRRNVAFFFVLYTVKTVYAYFHSSRVLFSRFSLSNTTYQILTYSKVAIWKEVVDFNLACVKLWLTVFSILPSPIGEGRKTTWTGPVTTPNTRRL